MMKKRRSFPSYLYILILLLIVVSLPKKVTMQIQGMTIAFLAPAWKQLTQLKSSQGSNVAQGKIKQLELDNQLLVNEVAVLKKILDGELLIESELDEFFDHEPIITELSYLHRNDVKHVIGQHLQSIPAEVIFRSPSSWKSSLWINQGTSTNEKLGRELIALNSPVVDGVSVVGVIDYVGKNQSRVKLITDSALNPSVRAVRIVEGKPIYLAKGELYGSLRSSKLKGVGFNYDFSDDEGSARDLRTGQIHGQTGQDAIPIIQQGDLLITTGMDGVFPPGLLVARVMEMDLLKEGDYTYQIEAESLVPNIEDLSIVYVLPPRGFVYQE